jgi:hypothetical protein
MSDHPSHRESRKQLLLTRIALERHQWAQEADDLQQRLEPRRLLPLMLRSAFGTGWVSALFSSPAASPGKAATAGLAERLAQAVLVARRYPLILSVVGGLLPWARARRGLGRVAIWSVVGLSAAGITWAWAKRRTPPVPAQTPFE